MSFVERFIILCPALSQSVQYWKFCCACTLYIAAFCISALFPCLFSYVVSVGLVDQLSEYYRSVTGPIEDSGTAHLIISGLNMLLAFTAMLHNE